MPVSINIFRKQEVRTGMTKNFKETLVNFSTQIHLVGGFIKVSCERENDYVCNREQKNAEHADP